MKQGLGWCFGVLWLLAGCGDDGGGSCPPEYPILREGFCYAEDGAAPTMDGGSTDATTPTADMTSMSDATVGDGGECSGEHPLVEGDRRYCEPGDCYCADVDTCFAAADAAGCCAGTPVCESDADGGTCMGTHPLVDGDRRYCEAGDCYCGTPDNCYPAATAAACCMVDPVCDS
ncbi:MAG: hypothetical protein JJ863_07750 [Deltaproteobacteria bacterium]|nr:hypothetical protein [Deltaproteobacteria bacterium]